MYHVFHDMSREMNEQQIYEVLNEYSVPCVYLELLFDSGNHACDGKFLHVNTAFETRFATTTSSMQEKTLQSSGFFAKTTLDNWLIECAHALDLSITYDEILYNIIPDAWLVTTAIPFTPGRVMVFLSEVKEHSLDRVHIEEFFSANLELMCITDMKGEFLKVNNEFERLLGYKPSEMEHTIASSYVHEEEYQRAGEFLARLDSSQELNQFVTRFRCKNGTYKTIEWKSQPHGDYIFSTGRDITAARKLHEDIKRKNEQLTSLATKLKEANNKLTTLAHRDQLTGLFNRTYFDAKVMFEMQSADRNASPLSMIVFDVDFFKTVNDTYGHPVGDEILILLSSILLQNARATDSAFRIGGEEFALLMPDTDSDTAKELAEHLRVSFEGRQHPQVGVVTASFGVAQRRTGESFSSWYRRVDNALYTAKNRGRNLVVCDSCKAFPIVSTNIDWQPGWNSGNTKIDNEHKELLRLALEINDSYYSDESKDTLNLLVEQLLFHVEKHFQDEETILKKIGYPDVTEHASLHTQLIQKMNLLKKDYQDGIIKPSAFFVFVLDEVIVGHLEQEDIKFFPYFTESTN